MNDPVEERAEEEEPVDERPRVAVPFMALVFKHDKVLDEAWRRGVDIPAAVRERMNYIAEVLCHGNSSGRWNPTITLPVPYTLADVEAVLGRRDEPPEAGSDAAWRAVRRLYDTAQNSRERIAGRTRGGI